MHELAREEGKGRQGVKETGDGDRLRRGGGA